MKLHTYSTTYMYYPQLQRYMHTTDNLPFQPGLVGLYQSASYSADLQWNGMC